MVSLLTGSWTWLQAEEKLPGQNPAFRGLQGTFNAVGEFGIWKNHRPLTVPWGPYRHHYISWSKRAGCIFKCHMRSPEPLLLPIPQRSSSEFFKSSPLFPIVPCFLLCFSQTHAFFQQDQESSMIVSNVLKCLLEICHFGDKQDVAKRDLLKTYILFWRKVQLSILYPFVPSPLKTLIRGKGRIWWAKIAPNCPMSTQLWSYSAPNYS